VIGSILGNQLQRAFVIENMKIPEDQLRTIIDTIPCLAWSAGPDGAAEFFNHRWLEFTGLSAEQARGWNWSVALHPEDLNRLIGYWKSILAKGDPGEIEARLRRYDGEYRWFLFRASPLREETGKVIQWYGTNTDIEDLKRAEERVQASEIRLRLLVDSIPGLVYTLTPSGDIESANQPILTYTGKTLDELKDWPALIHADDRAQVLTSWSNSITTGGCYEIEHRVLGANGEYRWFHARGLPYRDPSGGIVRWYVLLSDISERKHVEDARRARDQELSLIVETIPALLWCADPEGQRNYVNHKVLDYTGMALGDLTGSEWFKVIHPEDAETTSRAWSNTIKTGEPYDVQYRLRRHDGVYRWFRAIAQPLKDAEGKVIRWYGLLVDIDDGKEVQQTLRRTEQQLSRAMQAAAVGELAASIAHEVNQPLAAVVTNGQVCLRWLSAVPPDLDKAQESVERIVRDGKEAGQIVHRIRSLFDRSTAETAMVNLNEIISEVLDVLGSEMARKQITAEMNLEPNLPLVLGNRVQLQQLVLNLLLNAIEAIDFVEGAPNIIRVKSCQDTAMTVQVEIADTGIGLTDPDRIFEAFFTTKPDRLGMGLPICRSIIEAHGGRLWTSPGEQRGITFCFTLPLSARTKRG
jgi:PAS domain S-box-containing protein